MEFAPRVTRAAILRDPTIAAGIGQFAAIQAVAPIGIELSAVGVGPRDVDAIEGHVAAFARGANGGLVVTASPFGGNHPDELVSTDAAIRKALKKGDIGICKIATALGVRTGSVQRIKAEMSA
jgi:putative ABC transport system substrate-binding protein